MRLLSVIEEPLVIERILRHLGLSELACLTYVRLGSSSDILAHT
jgi:hypothetical protein